MILLFQLTQTKIALGYSYGKIGHKFTIFFL